MGRPSNPADGMTKTLKCNTLNNSLRSGKAIFPVKQCLIRSSDTNKEKAGSNYGNDLSTNHPINHDQLTASRTRDSCNIECETYSGAIPS